MIKRLQRRMILVVLVAGIIPMSLYRINITYLAIAIAASLSYIYYNDLVQQDVQAALVANQKKQAVMQEHIISGLASLIENRDLETGEHVARTSRYVKLLSECARADGVYADLRTASNLRFQLQSELTRLQNRMSRWFSIYFPEYKNVYGRTDAKSGMMILKRAPLPEDIVALGVEGVNQIWREAKLKGAGLKRARVLVDAAEHSIGSMEGIIAARLEIRILLASYESTLEQLQEIMTLIESLVKQIPMAEKLMEIEGIGIKSVSGFLAEVGDVSRFDSPKQLQKLAGLAIRENSSGKHKGETTITKRGRKRLRYLLFEAAMSLVSKNAEFAQLHRYYTTRRINPLKKMQSLMAIACKLIRVFYTLLTRNVDYDSKKMISDIKRPEDYTQAA